MPAPTDFVPASVHAFAAHESALRKKHGPLTLYVRPQLAAVPRAPRGGLVVGGWAFLDGEPALLPEELDILVLTIEGPDGTPRSFPRSPTAVLDVLARYVEKHAKPCAHLALRVPEDDRPALIARLLALPDHDGMTAAKQRVFYPVLKEAGWAHKDLVVHTRLLERADAPIVAFAEDLPDEYVFLTRQDAPNVDVRAQLQASIANLTARQADFAMIAPLVLASAGSELSAERILDPGFLRAVHERLGPEIWVGVPHRLALYAVGAGAAPSDVVTFVTIVGFETERGPSMGHAPVSKLAFRVVNGGVEDAVPLESLAAVLARGDGSRRS